jgi:tetratricopeptide (TPR) repeat protein
MIDAALKVKDFDEIDNVKVRSYAFRMLGITAILDEDYNKAEESLLKAQEVLSESDDELFTECYRAINDSWLSRVYFETGRFDECREMLDRWDGNSMFEQDVYREILLRDLIIPYYQVRCMYQIAMIYEGSEGEAYSDVRERESEISEICKTFIDICEESGYMKTELYTLLLLQSQYPPVSPEAKALVFENLQKVYDQLFNEQNISYANVIDGTVLNSMQDMVEAEQEYLLYVRRNRLIALTIIVGIVFLAMITIFITQRKTEGIRLHKVFDKYTTRLYN